VVDLGDVTVQLVHAPGHTSGHSVYLIESDSGRVLVTGDIDLSSFGPYYGDAASGLDDFEHTLQHVRAIEADHYVTFHHKGVVDGHESFVQAVDAYAAVIVRRHAQLLQLLEQRRTFDELVREGIVYRPGTRPAVFGESVERYTIRRHLERALGDSSATTDGHHYWRTEVQA
jgi:glyoxylase-like metal-dependent hydrolase (beta-lactamase superfamily II)